MYFSSWDLHPGWVQDRTSCVFEVCTATSSWRRPIRKHRTPCRWACLVSALATTTACISFSHAGYRDSEKKVCEVRHAVCVVPWLLSKTGADSSLVLVDALWQCLLTASPQTKSFARTLVGVQAANYIRGDEIKVLFYVRYLPRSQESFFSLLNSHKIPVL